MKTPPLRLASRLAVIGVVGSLVLGGSMVWAAPAAAKPVAKVAAKPAAKAAPAKAVTPTTIAAPALPDASVDKSARVMVLDKQTNRRLVLVMVAGEPQAVGPIQVKLTKCLPDYAAVLGQDVAWLDVTESASGTGRTAPWFSGWMFNTYPEISTLDHPRFDVQLQGCGVKAREVVKTTGSAPIIDSTPPADTETPDDEPANTEQNGNSDPYYVPGVEKKTEAPAAVETPPVAIEQDQPADTETPANDQPITDEAAPVSGPVPPTAPAAPVPTAPVEQQDLHKMMDSGTY